MKKIWMCMLVVGLMTTGCSLMSSSSTSTVKGSIEYNMISAISTVSGKITTMNKQQGELVKKGDIIAVIDNTNQTYMVDQLQAVVNIKKAKLEELQAGTRPQQIKQAEAQVQAVKAQLDLLTSGNRKEQIEQAKNHVFIAQEALNSAKITVDYVTAQYNKALNLYQEGSLSKDELDSSKYKLDTTANQVTTAQYQVEAAKQQLALLQNGPKPEEITAANANYEVAKAQLALLQSGSTKQTIDGAQADLDQAIAQWNQARNTLNNYNIVALEDGIIISKNIELGDVVTVSSNIADIAVSNDLYVLCYIPDEYIDRINYNQSLTVTAAGEVLTGRVSSIALKHEYTPKDRQSTTDSKRITTKVKIALKDIKGALKPGMTVDVEIPRL
jgi:HlyD family secretion protein